MTNDFQADIADTAGFPERTVPDQVRWALFLLWSSLALNLVWTLYMLYQIKFRHPVFTFDIVGVMLALPLVGCAVNALLNIMIARRQNWSRVCQLVLFAMALAWQLFVLPNNLDIGLLRFLIHSALELTALYLLFLTPASEWFRPVRPEI